MWALVSRCAEFRQMQLHKYNAPPARCPPLPHTHSQDAPFIALMMLSAAAHHMRFLVITPGYIVGESSRVESSVVESI